MKQAIGYIRVSTERQVNEGDSLDAQKVKIKAWCELNDYELVAIYEDAGISGKNMTKRPGLNEALNLAKPDMALVVHSLSRLARSTKDCLDIGEQLKANKCELVSLTEKIDTSSAMGQLFFTLIAAMAQMERQQISERTAAASAYKKDIGDKYSPCVPFGYKEIEGKLEAVKKETQLIAEIISRRAAGATLRSIADWLNDKGIIGKQGGKWHASSVSYVLKRQDAA